MKWKRIKREELTPFIRWRHLTAPVHRQPVAGIRHLHSIMNSDRTVQQLPKIDLARSGPRKCDWR